MPSHDLTGRRFGKLTITSFSHKDNKYRYNIWNCLCDCGNTVKSSTASLNRKNRPTQSCGCLRIEMLRINYDFGRLEVSIANINSLFASYKKSAKMRRIDFELSKDEFILMTSRHCFYCNKAPSQVHSKKETNGAYLYNGIDRLDSSIGYLYLNCVSCCKVCNYAKREMEEKEFYEWIEMVYNNIRSRKHMKLISDGTYTESK